MEMTRIKQECSVLWVYDWTIRWRLNFKTHRNLNDTVTLKIAFSGTMAKWLNSTCKKCTMNILRLFGGKSSWLDDFSNIAFVICFYLIIASDGRNIVNQNKTPVPWKPQWMITLKDFVITNIENTCGTLLPRGLWQPKIPFQRTKQ